MVEERKCHVYVLFGKVVTTIDEPGLHFSLLAWAGSAGDAWLAKRYVLDMRLDQEYLAATGQLRGRRPHGHPASV